MYRALDPKKIIATIDLLRRRIDERFPHNDLAAVAADLCAAARDTQGKAEALAKPGWIFQTLVTALIASLAGVLVYAVRNINLAVANTETTNIVQTLEACANLAVLGGVATISLVSVKSRMKRRQALRGLHQLRSLVHVIDMHQLTKDPSLVTATETITASSPPRHMTPFELGRYLDYCSEMLALTGKVAALYAQTFPDPVVVVAVNDIEMLATNLSGKIWQKIAILQRAVQSEEIVVVSR
jgi:hypothetical protein